MDGPSPFPEKGLKTLIDDPYLKEIYGLVKDTGDVVYLVGGLLRNVFLGLPPERDYDFAVVTGDLKGFCTTIAQRLGGSSFLLDEESQTFRVAVKDGGDITTLDFAPLRGGDIKEDLLSRDFTVNAMAVDLKALFEEDVPVVSDPFGGREDCKERVIRPLSIDVFDHDPLRLLRAVRLSQRYGLTVTEDTASVIKEKAGLLKRSAPERVRDELIMIFASKGTAKGIAMLYDLGLVGAVIPEIEGWRDIGGYDLLEHSLATVREAESILEELEKGGRFKDMAPGLMEHLEGRVGAVKRTTILKFSAFLHDIGKPLTIKKDEAGLRFIGHDREGARLLKRIFTRLRFSRRVVQETANLVRNHHRTFTLASIERPTVRTKAHFFRAVGGEPGLSLLLLALADARATRGTEDEELFELVREMTHFYFKHYIVERPKPLMDGNEIMKTFGVSEGPMVGEIMEMISKGLEQGIIKTKDDAVEYVKKRLKKRGI